MNKFIICFVFLKSSILLAQTKYNKFDLIVGCNLQKKTIVKSPFIVGIGKEINLRYVIILSYAKSEFNFNGWLTNGAGIRLIYTDKYYKQNLYIFIDTYFPFQNGLHKQEQNLGPMSARIGVGYVTKKLNKFDFGLGFSENWKPFIDLEYRTSLKIRVKNKKKTYKCPPLQ
jgi:hypothetical protein